MKRLFAVLIAASVVASPMMLATAANAAPPSREMMMHRDHNWERGQRLSPADRHRAANIDYRRYRLAPPPRGYRWVRIDNRFLLVDPMSGLIRNIGIGR